MHYKNSQQLPEDGGRQMPKRVGIILKKQQIPYNNSLPKNKHARIHVEYIS